MTYPVWWRGEQEGSRQKTTPTILERKHGDCWTQAQPGSYIRKAVRTLSWKFFVILAMHRRLFFTVRPTCRLLGTTYPSFSIYLATQATDKDILNINADLGRKFLRRGLSGLRQDRQTWEVYPIGKASTLVLSQTIFQLKVGAKWTSSFFVCVCVVIESFLQS